MMFHEIHKELYSTLPFVLTSIGEMKQKDVNRPNGFDSHHFLWIKKGEGRFCIDGESFVLHDGEGVFIREGIPHSYHGNDFYTEFVTFTMETKMLEYLGASNWFRFQVPAFLEHDFNQLYHFARGNSTVLSRSAAGYSLVTEIFSAVLHSQETPAVRVLQMLECRYHEFLTLDQIASEVGMDRFSLCHYYMSQRGVTVMEDLHRIRIEKAKRFLKYSNDPIKKIGQSCGFESASYFGKRFRETVGCTPSEYRKRYGESVIH